VSQTDGRTIGRVAGALEVAEDLLVDVAKQVLATVSG